MREKPGDENGIIEKVKKGDNEAVSEIVDQYSDRLFNLLFRLLRNKEEAEDALQETFITMIQKISTFGGQSQLYTWLYRIATNIALMKLRSRKKEHDIEIDENILSDSVHSGSIISFSSNPEKEFSRKEIKSALDHAIEELPAIYRSAFILKDIEQLSIREISEILGISEDNVKTRIRRARIFLRNTLSEELS